MITLGVNVSGDVAYLGFADGKEILDAEPYMLRRPQGLEVGADLIALRDDVRKVLSANAVERVRILDPETNHRGPYTSFVDRFTVETVMLLAGVEQGIDTARVSRASIRSALGVGRGVLKTHAKQILVPVGPHWAGKRDIAALAAYAINGS